METETQSAQSRLNEALTVENVRAFLKERIDNPCFAKADPLICRSILSCVLAVFLQSKRFDMAKAELVSVMMPSYRVRFYNPNGKEEICEIPDWASRLALYFDKAGISQRKVSYEIALECLEKAIAGPIPQD